MPGTSCSSNSAARRMLGIGSPSAPASTVGLTSWEVPVGLLCIPGGTRAFPPNPPPPKKLDQNIWWPPKKGGPTWSPTCS